MLLYVLFVCKCVLPPGDSQTAVNKYINIKSYQSSPCNRQRRPRGGEEVQPYSLLNLGDRKGWVFKATPRPLYPRERPGTRCIGGWMGPRACLDGCGKSHPHRNSIKSHHNTGLRPRLSYPGANTNCWPKTDADFLYKRPSR